MNRTKNLKGACSHCGALIQFPAESIGLSSPCPHCGNQTDLMLATPPQEPAIPRKVILWTILTLIILGCGLGGSLVALKRAEKWAARQKATRAAPASVGPSTNQPGGAANPKPIQNSGNDTNR